MNNDIKEILQLIGNCCYCGEISEDKCEKYCNYITNLQEKVNQYENPDDMTLMFMWCDEKAKDKIKQLQEENERLKIECSQLEKLDYLEELNREKLLVKQIDEIRKDYKSRCEKAIEEIDIIDTTLLSNINSYIAYKIEKTKKILTGDDK